MKRLKAALAAGTLVITAAGVGVIASSNASAEVAGWERIQYSWDAPGGGNYSSGAAYCTSGKKVLGGGWGQTDNAYGLVVAESHPTGSGSGWNIRVKGGTETVQMATYAICATP
jgi:hypothetical protein